MNLTWDSIARKELYKSGSGEVVTFEKSEKRLINAKNDEVLFRIRPVHHIQGTEFAVYQGNYASESLSVFTSEAKAMSHAEHLIRYVFPDLQPKKPIPLVVKARKKKK